MGLLRNAVVSFLFIAAGVVYSTPSTQIWIPSTDIQAFLNPHFGLDSYIKVAGMENAANMMTTTNVGLTMGISPFKYVGAEVGVDYRDFSGYHEDPLYLNAKIGTPENLGSKYMPAIAIGAYDIGTRTGVTDYNIAYGLLAKNIGKLGRFSAGYYTGNDNLLGEDNDGVLLSWDRVITEVSEKLWFAVDYQGGENGYGALSFGAAWMVAPNAGIILGYDMYNAAMYKPTVTLQIDINAF